MYKDVLALVFPGVKPVIVTKKNMKDFNFSFSSGERMYPKEDEEGEATALFVLSSLRVTKNQHHEARWSGSSRETRPSS